MFPFRNHLRWAIPLTAVLLSVAPTSAGWMGFRNDTPNTLVIQETIPSGPVARPGRLQKLFASETVRDTPPASGQRQFQIFDANKPDKPLYSGNFPCPSKNENILYVIKADGKGGLTIEAMKLAVGGAVTPPAVKKDPPAAKGPTVPILPKSQPPKKK